MDRTANDSVVVWIGSFNKEEMPLQNASNRFIIKRLLHSLDIGRNADDWEIMLVSTLYGANATPWMCWNDPSQNVIAPILYYIQTIPNVNYVGNLFYIM